MLFQCCSSNVTLDPTALHGEFFAKSLLQITPQQRESAHRRGFQFKATNITQDIQLRCWRWATTDSRIKSTQARLNRKEQARLEFPKFA